MGVGKHTEVENQVGADQSAAADWDELGNEVEAAGQAELGNLAEADNPVGVDRQIGAREVFAVCRVEGLMQL